jgi:nickel/cobalt transporter (NicO) family protein
MIAGSNLLVTTAVVIGFVHVVLGPDHYVPFIALARARQWTHRKAMWITLLSGVGHVLSSAVIGLCGIVFGVEVLKLSALESARGTVAGWLLFGFGVAYMIWGMRRALRRISHTHSHGALTHAHFGPQAHAHERANVTPWVIFIIFVFGPCEPLIPLAMYPAAKGDWWSALTVVIAFSVACVTTMLALVYASLRGMECVSFPTLQRYVHALAGFAVAACGAGIVFLQL